MSRCVVCRCCCDGDPSHKKDSAWAWMVCFAASTNLAFTMGLVYSFGVLLPVFMDYFNESRERTAWIGSLSISLGLFFGPFAGTLINRFGCRVVSMTGGLICALSLTIASFAKSLILLYLSYSVLGMGGICVFLSSMVIVRNCFDKQQSVAVGIASTGQGVGIMVLSQVLQSLIISVEWRNTLRIVAGSLFLNSFFGILYDSKMEPSNSGESLSCREAGQGLQMSQCFTLHCSVWKVPSFLAVVSLFFFMMFGRTIMYVLLVKYSEDLGISSNASSRLVLYLGINMVIGRFACGFLCSLKRLNNWFILQGMLLLNTISTIMLTLANSYAGLVIYAIIFGLCDGAMATVFNIQVLTCVDQSQAASAYGLTLMIGSVTSLIGPPLSGFTVDKLGSYGPAFYMAAGALAVASLIPCVLHCVHTSEIKRTEVLSEAQELEQWSHDRDNCVCHFSRTPTDLDQVQFVSTV